MLYCVPPMVNYLARSVVVGLSDRCFNRGANECVNVSIVRTCDGVHTEHARDISAGDVVATKDGQRTIVMTWGSRPA